MRVYTVLGTIYSKRVNNFFLSKVRKLLHRLPTLWNWKTHSYLLQSSKITIIEGS